ncbi:riboflavin synthase [Clostridium sp. E02]|uniref:riboflavin synthase n=1 Tax=Clostridium sp. E02 TaxID=2487134 RepID=UPI000F5368F8|nr:riboflavin synthase [Clostridium sp. E02]
MFTGIVEEIGQIRAVKKGAKSATLTIQGNVIFSDLKLGDSVATNGVCLTVTEIKNNQFTADIMNETLARSSMGNLNIGSYVNLERALSAKSRFGGHIVLGHIDGVGKITEIKKDDNAIWYTIKTNSNLMRYMIEKGSITIDGISLTVANVERDNFSFSIIPHTAKETILYQRKIGSIVNLENDIIGKYIEKFISTPKGITNELLQENGF